jgi:hypothetical protein
MPMNQGIKVEWLRRLRQPERVQGVSVLRDHEGHQCCLDVLMEMAVEQGTQPPPVLKEIEKCYYYPNGDLPPESGLLTEAVQAWAGLELSDPWVRLDESTIEIASPGDPSLNLSEINDSGLAGFPKIADLIEADQDI